MKFMSILLLCSCFLGQAFASDQRIAVVRHGLASHNVEGIYNANPSHPNYKPSFLTDEGKEQAKATAEGLINQGFSDENIVAVYVSPLPRTVQTAEIFCESSLFSKAKMFIEPRLIETQLGELEGLPLLPVRDEASIEKYKSEKGSQVAQRVTELYHELLERHPDGNIILVTHGLPAQKLGEIIGGQTISFTQAEAKVFSFRQATSVVAR